MLALELTSVIKRFGALLAVDELALPVESGEFVSVLGPSGCGKSTTLRMILGLEAPTSGEIRVNGRVVTHQSPKERQIGIVFQDYAVFPHLSPRDNVAFGLKVAGMAASEQDREISTISESLLHLQPIFEKRTRDLNAAELQQIAVARTLVTKPTIVLFDEPLSNLEAFLRTRVRAQLKSLQRQLKQTAVFVTHDQSEAMALSDRIAVMNQGRLQQYGPPEELVSDARQSLRRGLHWQPSDEFCSPESCRSRMGRVSSAARESRLISAACRARRPRSGGFIWGFVRRKSNSAPPGKATIPARVEAVEYLGSELVVKTRVGAAAVDVLAPLTAVPPAGDPVGPRSRDASVASLRFRDRHAHPASRSGVMASISLAGVSKRFRDVQAISDLSIDVSDGEFFCILGPSGAGKSTTLRTIAGLHEPDSGDVLIDGRSMAGVHPRDRRVGFFFQEVALYPHLNGFDNIAFPLRQERLPKAEIKRRVAEIVEILHLSKLVDRKPATYSGAERQRVALARVLVRRSGVYLLDEPLSNLDAKLRLEARARAAPPAAGVRADNHLRDARSVRGRGDGGSDTGARPRQGLAGRHPCRRLRATDQQVRRDLHRHPGDEPDPLLGPPQRVRLDDHAPAVPRRYRSRRRTAAGRRRRGDPARPAAE